MAIPATDHLTDSAQQQLAALRGALVSRLAVLEAALADPTRGESLAGLILDLSRIATEEAQAAAAEACIATKAEADKQMTELRTSAKTALEAAQAGLRAANEGLERERATARDLRREITQTQLELQKQNELLKAREEYESELKQARDRLGEELHRAQEQMGYEIDRQQAIATELAGERDAALAAVRSELEAVRGANVELRAAHERAEAKLASVEREQAHIRAAHQADRAALEETQSDLATARAANEELRRGRDQSARLRNDLDAARLQLSELAAEHDAALREAGDRAERQRTELEGAKVQVGELAAERDALAAELTAARKWIDDLREAEAEFAAAAAAGEGSAPHVTPPLQAAESNEGWQPVQLASRLTFAEALPIDINGASARLLDLSVSGCQLVSESAVKPHQTVKVQLSSNPPLACGGKVVWTRLELAGAGQPPSYRAGIRFIRPDEPAIEAFALAHGGA